MSVRVDGFPQGTTKQLSTAQSDACMIGAVVEVLRYARIHSGTREDYRKAGGRVDVGESGNGKRKNAWMDVIRESYQGAWNGESYPLLDAWVSSNVKQGAVHS